MAKIVFILISFFAVQVYAQNEGTDLYFTWRNHVEKEYAAKLKTDSMAKLKADSIKSTEKNEGDKSGFQRIFGSNFPTDSLDVFLSKPLSKTSLIGTWQFDSTKSESFGGRINIKQLEFRADKKIIFNNEGLKHNTYYWTLSAKHDTLIIWNTITHNGIRMGPKFPITKLSKNTLVFSKQISNEVGVYKIVFRRKKK